VSLLLTSPAPQARTGEDHGRRLALLIGEFSAHVQQQLYDGVRWRRWQSTDRRLASFANLSAVVKTWQNWPDDDSVRLGVAALVSLGSTRGEDDQLAALAALVLMTGGVCRLSHDLRGSCEPEDVIVAIWQEIRRAEPDIGRLAARLLIRRARQRLGRETRVADRVLVGNVSEELVRLTGEESLAHDPEPQPIDEFVELMTWAERSGVVTEDDVALLAELVDEERAGASRMEAVRRASARRGITDRSIRRHRQHALEALRRAVPDYLAATA
jgi:hypothetical protein